jgi:RNA polymerase subunit RPABC4/transcription elongation factor Spt4
VSENKQICPVCERDFSEKFKEWRFASQWQKQVEDLCSGQEGLTKTLRAFIICECCHTIVDAEQDAEGYFYVKTPAWQAEANAALEKARVKGRAQGDGTRI